MAESDERLIATPSRALITDANGRPIASSTTATEIGYVNGVTSSIQTQLGTKQATGNYITALTGDVTASGPGSVASTIANSAVTNAKLSQMAALTLKGNNTGSTANAADLTVAQIQTMLASPRSVYALTSIPVYSSTTPVVLGTFTIPANTFQNGDTIVLTANFVSAGGGAGTVTFDLLLDNDSVTESLLEAPAFELTGEACIAGFQIGLTYADSSGLISIYTSNYLEDGVPGVVTNIKVAPINTAEASTIYFVGSNDDGATTYIQFAESAIYYPAPA